MTDKLKTLQDLGNCKKDKGVVGKFELKVEAIKWVKKLQECFKDVKNGFDCKGLPELRVDDGEWCSDGYYNGEVIGQINNFIKHFFNISEKELADA